VVSEATAQEMQDDERSEEQGRESAEYPHPEWRTDRSGVRARARVDASFSFGIRGKCCHWDPVYDTVCLCQVTVYR